MANVVAVGDEMGWPSHQGQVEGFCSVSHKRDMRGGSFSPQQAPMGECTQGINLLPATVVAQGHKKHPLLSSAHPLPVINIPPSARALGAAHHGHGGDDDGSSSPSSPAQGSLTRRWCNGCCTSRSWTTTASAVTTPSGRCPSPSTRWTSPRCKPSGRI